MTEYPPTDSSHHRDPNGRYMTSPEAMERDAQAVRLRARRMSYLKIADAMGYQSPQAAMSACKRGLARVGRDTILEARELLLEHMDQLAEVCWGVIARRHVIVQNGRIIREQTPDGPITLEDDGPYLEAVDRLLKIEKQRADILGVAAPKRVEVITRDAVDQAIADLESELARRGHVGPPGVPETTPGTPRPARP